MVSSSFTSVSAELRERFVALLDSLSGLRILSQVDIESVTEETLLNQALAALAKHQDLEYCSIFLKDGDQLRCVAGASIEDGLSGERTGISQRSGTKAGGQFAIGEGITGLACQTRQLQYCRNCQTDERFKPPSQADGANSIGALISVPICFGDEVLGVLNASHPMPEFFDVWHQHMLSLFASMLGQMWHNHRMINHLDKMVRSRTRCLERALRESDELKRCYQELSTLDALTGLHNRRYFFAEAEAVLNQAARHRQPLTLLLMDVDHFKQINDRWGHTMGDRALVCMAEVIRGEMRAGDIVARMGGEEFAMVLPNTGLEGADLLAARIQRKIGILDLCGEGETHGVTVSIGITAFTEIEDTSYGELLDRLYAQADWAMYECKRRGRNRRLFYRQDMDRCHAG